VEPRRVLVRCVAHGGVVAIDVECGHLPEKF
jgi:hypothetical protein